MVEIKERFLKVSNRWLDDAYVPRRTHVPPVLYHYTDAAGLSGTLRTGRVWATDSRFLNDREELKHSRTAAQVLLQQEALECKDEILSRLYREILEYQGIPNPASYFVFSLTTQKDDLSQWRGYANDGRGFTIGFSGPDLLKLRESENCEFGFARVEYDHDSQRRALREALDDIRTLLVEVLNEPDVDQDTAFDVAASQYDGIVEARAAVNKHRSFSSEEEWRTVTQVSAEDDDVIMTRVSGDKIIPYIDLDLKVSDKGKLPIVEIGIGPGFTGEDDEIPVRLLCKETGYNPKIYFADTPYRRD